MPISVASAGKPEIGNRVPRDILNLDQRSGGRFGPEGLDLHDLEAVRLLLQGSSVLDWDKLYLRDRAEVDAFLRLILVEPDDAADRERLRFVFNQAVNYLEESFELRFPAELRNPADVRDVFVAASDWDRSFRRRQVLACTVLKLMHTIHHMEAADLKFQCRVSEAELLDRAEKRIVRHAEDLRAQGFPLLAFYGSRKTRPSMITKLLSKKESIAATIFDKLRFRVVVETQDEVVPVIALLARTLFPFSYVIPGQSQNSLVSLRRVIRETPHYQRLVASLPGSGWSLASWLPEKAENPFSGTGYRTVNFIVDFPVKLEDSECDINHGHLYLLGRVVFVMVEFQVVDRETDRLNDTGDNAHAVYKARQHEVVEQRLLRGSARRLRREEG